MMNLAKFSVLAFALAAVIGCGNDKAAEANKNLKPVDPNAPKPSAASGANPGAGASKGPTANEGPIK